MRKLFILITLLVLSIMVLALSWVSSPILSNLGIFPKGIASWADDIDHVNLRTAVPMVVWGLLAGIWIKLISLKGSKPWVIAWLLGLLLITIAEMGQFFLPNRSPHFGDIGWGIGGTTFGLSIAFLLIVAGNYFYSFFQK